MYTRSLEVSKPWIVWIYGLGAFSIFVWIGGWFLTDEVRLPDAKDYRPVNDRDEDDIIDAEIEEENRLWREEEEETIDIERAISPGKHKHTANGSRLRTQDDDELDGSSDDEYVEGVSKHLLSREH
jgi:hypothetical protein